MNTSLSPLNLVLGSHNQFSPRYVLVDLLMPPYDGWLDVWATMVGRDPQRLPGLATEVLWAETLTEEFVGALIAHLQCTW